MSPEGVGTKTQTTNFQAGLAVLPPTETAENKSVNFKLFAKRRYDRVLELGPYDGTDSVALSRCCTHLDCIEGRKENCERVRKTLQDHHCFNVTVHHSDLETIDLTTLARYDCAWASGVLYHMKDPARLIKQITSVTDLCYGWTHLSDTGSCHFQPEDVTLPLAGLSPLSWWYTPAAFIECWSKLEWKCEFTTTPALHPNSGLAAQFIARRA